MARGVGTRQTATTELGALRTGALGVARRAAQDNPQFFYVLNRLVRDYPNVPRQDLVGIANRGRAEARQLAEQTELGATGRIPQYTGHAAPALLNSARYVVLIEWTDSRTGLQRSQHVIIVSDYQLSRDELREQALDAVQGRTPGAFGEYTTDQGIDRESATVSLIVWQYRAAA